MMQFVGDKVSESEGLEVSESDAEVSESEGRQVSESEGLGVSESAAEVSESDVGRYVMLYYIIYYILYIIFYILYLIYILFFLGGWTSVNLSDFDVHQGILHWLWLIADVDGMWQSLHSRSVLALHINLTLGRWCHWRVCVCKWEIDGGMDPPIGILIETMMIIHGNLEISLFSGKAK